jgi:hypothetical protein
MHRYCPIYAIRNEALKGPRDDLPKKTTVSTPVSFVLYQCVHRMSDEDSRIAKQPLSFYILSANFRSLSCFLFFSFLYDLYSFIYLSIYNNNNYYYYSFCKSIALFYCLHPGCNYIMLSISCLVSPTRIPPSPVCLYPMSLSSMLE